MGEKISEELAIGADIYRMRKSVEEPTIID